MVISLDTEKAVVRVFSSTFLHKSNLGVKKHWSASVTANGYRSDNFPLHRSTHQSCPCSPFEVQDAAIKGINVGEAQHKTFLYADNILLYMSEPMTSIPHLVDIISLFGSFSGHEINFSKSLAMTIESLRERTNPLASFPFS